jgi:hypothetical protein
MYSCFRAIAIVLLAILINVLKCNSRSSAGSDVSLPQLKCSSGDILCTAKDASNKVDVKDEGKYNGGSTMKSNSKSHLRRRLGGRDHHIFGHSHATSSNHTICRPGGVVVRLNDAGTNSATTGSTSSLYLLRNGKLRLIPDIETAHAFADKGLRQDPIAVTLATFVDITQEEFKLFSLDEKGPTPSLKHPQTLPDYDLDFILDKVKTLQSPTVIKKTLKFGMFFHPAVTKLASDKKLDILLVHRGFRGSLNEIPEFSWMYKHKFHHHHNHNLTKIKSWIDDREFSYANITTPPIDVKGYALYNREQVRMIELPLDCYECPRDTSNIAAMVHLSYTRPANTGSHTFTSHMETSNLIIYKNGTLENTMIRSLVPIDQANPYSVEKNWMPFLYKNTPHFIYKIVPLTIVTINNTAPPPPTSEVSGGNEVYVNYLPRDDTCDYQKIPWKYGHLSGGTSALLLPNSDNEYLGFFHSKFNPGKLFGSWTPSAYFWGAFTFTSSPSFRITRMSRFPIIEPWMYDGLWYSQSTTRITTSYLVYPMGFFFHKIEEEGKSDAFDVIVSMCWQEEMGLLATINLDDLLESMDVVQC